MAEKNVLTEDDKNDDEIVIVEDPKKVADSPKTEDDDDRIETYAEDDAPETDAEREAIRERRRIEKQERKERRETAIKRDKTELNFLRKRNEDLERRVSVQEQRAHQVDLSGYDQEIAKASSEAEMADRVIAKAVEAGNGADVTQAMRYRDQALYKIQQLNAHKQQFAQQKPQAPTNQVDDLTMQHAREFMKENPWYDVHGRDEDSAVVIAIDQTLAKDGYNSQSEDYWVELRKRAARRLPEHFKQKGEDRVARGGPAVGSGREHAPTSTRKEMYISPERKQALIDAGVWDDPVLRQKYVKRYAEYDRENRA